MGNCCCDPDVEYEHITLVRDTLSDKEKERDRKKDPKEVTCLLVLKKYLPEETFVPSDPLFNHSTTNGIPTNGIPTNGIPGSELDLHCPRLRLTIQYHGISHFQFTPSIHRSMREFDEQKYRDDFKVAACKRKGIKLITIRYDCPNVEVELISQLHAHKFI